MKTFAEKHNQRQQKSSANLARQNTLASAASLEVHPLLHLQRTIGNQAVLRLLQAARSDALEAGSDIENGSSPEVRSDTQITNRFAHDFSRIPIHAHAPTTTQPKLHLSTPGDSYEKEADHISEQVMHMSEPKLQRACACGGGCPACETEQPSHEHERLQTKRLTSTDGEIAAPPIVHEVLASAGQPLDTPTRAFFEPRFGQDFSRVRVHSDAIAEQSAREVNAHAYTVGHDIVFGASRFGPATQDGRRLIAHELTHVVQQPSAGQMIQRNVKKEPPLPPPQLPTLIIPGSTDLSRRAQAYRIDNPNLPDSANVLVVEYSTAKSGRKIEVIPNRPGVAHSEAEMDQFLTEVRRQARWEVTVHEIYSERQPCGPSDSDCEGMLRKRYPRARTTFGYGYQETEAPARDSRAARTKSNIAAAHQRVTESRQLEWDFPGRTPPPHFQRNEPGPISRRPRRFGGSGSRGGRAFSKFVSRFGSRGGDDAGAAVIVNFLVEKFSYGPQSERFLAQELKRLQPDIYALLKNKEKEVLELQRRGEIAYANITLRLDSTARKGQASALALVTLNKIEVTDWYKEGTDLVHKGISFAALGEHVAGMSSEFMTYSEGLSLHPDLVAEGADRLESRLQAIERGREQFVISPEKIDQLGEEHDLVFSCLEKLLSEEGITSFGMLAAICSDLIPQRRPGK